MPNIGAAINAHNKNILEESQPLERGGCNCRIPENCPLEGECLTKNVLYEATITSDIINYGERLYRGITDPIFKKRFKNHEKSFNHKKYSKETELSKEIWRIKAKNASYNVTWRIIKQYRSYNPNTKRCMLCVNEKLAILNHDGDNLLNKKSEIVSTCRHKHKYRLT